jgi:Tol biopolymer transport system component
MTGDKEAYPLLNSDYDQGGPAFSPDGNWLAYESNETGRYEIYLVPFPNPTSKLVVSKDGGEMAQWLANGKELYYHSPDGTLMVASLQNDKNGLQITGTRPLFKNLLF